ncbi:MAG TPA: diguanylate cyclase [Rhodanobacteraceae bacterium]|nr:diguanylate cyclase [Rhodanobacteraceae bacterium]
MRRWLGAILLWMFAIPAALALDARLPFRAFILDNWSVEQGLPQITAFSIVQDRAGYLWIGTQIALARFDGTRFTTFDRDHAGVDTGTLTASWADQRGQVWFGGPQGLLRERNGHFDDLGGNAVFAIMDVGDDMPLLATSRGLARVQGERIVPIAGYDGAAYSLLRDGNTLWIGGAGRLCHAAFPAQGSLHSPVCMAVAAHDEQPQIAWLARAQHILWLGSHAGLMRVDGDRIVPAGLGDGVDHSTIESLYTDHDGVLWVGTVDALYRYLPDRTLETLAEADIARDPWVQALFEDRAGNLWMGSHTEGLYRVWNGWARRVSTRDGLADPFVWSVLRAPDGGIVFGTNSDIETFDGRHTHVLLSGKALPNPTAYELYYDHRGRLWIGTRGGIALYDHGRIATPPPLNALTPWQINDIREVADDDFWIASSGGLYRWHDAALTRADPGAGIAAARIRTILPLAADHLLLGTEDGVREWHDGKLTSPAWAAPLRGHFVSRLAWLRPGVLGVATIDAGVGTMVNGQLRMTNSKDGLPSDNAWTLDVLDDYLYVASIAGVWRLPLAQLPLPGSPTQHVTPQLVAGQGRDGSMQHVRCCNGGAGARSLIDGHAIWYSTVSGALRLDLDALGPHPQPPASVIEAVEHAGHQFPAQPFTLHDGTRDLSVQYTAPYLRVETLHFHYQLQGYDTGWQDAADRRAAFYTHLPPGNYRFRVAAAFAGGQRFGKEADLPITVPPYWYERGVVRFGAWLLSLLALGWLLWWWWRAQQRRNTYLEAQVARRTDQLARANERLRLANLALAEESHTDALTALHNRRHLLAELPGFLVAGASVGVMLIDLDNFKQVNDRYGHSTGDNVLFAIGRLLGDARRGSDLTVRWGGEEFLLLLNGVDATSAFATAERLRRDIAATDFGDGRGGKIRLTCSIGFSLHPLAEETSNETFEAALELADLALYRAKRDGRNLSMGLITTAPLAKEILQQPLARQLDGLLANGQVTWVRAES